jgi:hypothetical protein
MPLPANSGFFMSSGFVPFLLGAALFMLSGGLSVSVWSKGGNPHLWQWLKNYITNTDNKRFFIMLILILIYIVGLLGRVHFGLATFLFHFFIFYYLKVGKILITIFYAILATALVAFIIPAIFEMPLP